MPQETCYQYFKEALIVWTLTRSQQVFMERGVRMNCVAPGPVMTPILGDEVAAVIAFLCSDAARWVGGVNLPVDGGLASTCI
ncbi:hypothetical protein SAMN04489708_12263 [Paracidovorax cattleyae]|uniref:Enoyl-(Acyl carrier protein) reductase n=1 Tax=Paracidovorax cattleyae TaxID=80868 RepID=A0A1H0UZK4_9BURK|nr:hypothetical protein SAMN04489708_12263 [Paracidovorax cattleyae]